MLETAKQVAHKQVSDNNGISVGAGMSSSSYMQQKEAEVVVVDDPLGGQTMEIKLPMMDPTSR